MVSGFCCSYPVNGRKCLKLLAAESWDSEPLVCYVPACAGEGGCPEQHLVASCSGDLTQNAGVFPAMQEYACSTGNNGVVYPQSGTGYSVGRKTKGAHLQHQHLDGCMYMNEHGQMSGPYPPEQLYEGLSTGLLPQNHVIYAVFSGKTADHLSLCFLKQFIAQLNVAAMDSTPNASVETKKVASHANGSSRSSFKRVLLDV
ncbi:histone-lysine N-methyltransferase ATXR7-like isoform X1 [Miscanthus floridulus]|uniref:histone-lysine N-methyltransferase ATXR7-like isoform X1 n=1 Tax=Miscanthus floridulus TaxID=154761 RepID=UPI0034583839